MSIAKTFSELLHELVPVFTVREEAMKLYKDIMEGYDDSWEDLMDELDDRGHVDMDKFRFPTRDIKPPARDIKPPVKNKVCECGKDEHGFATHADFCPKYDPDKDGNGGI